MSDFGDNLVKCIIKTLVMAPVYATAGYIAYRTGRGFYNHEMRRLDNIERDSKSNVPSGRRFIFW